MTTWKRILPLLLAVSLMSCAVAQTGKTALINENGPNPVVRVVRQVREAVVQIKVESKVTVQNFRNPFFDDPWFRQFFPEQRQQQRPVTSMGSGFIYEFNPQTREAFIMTNNHVVEKGREGTITVTLADKISYTATLVGLDPNTDVAVIKITLKEGDTITIAPLGDSSNLEIGDWAIAIGNPFGDSGLDRTVTLGVISAIGRSNLNFGSGSPIYQDYIQTDAAINPGNSGGPLLNINGEVIGINSAITSTSGGNIGIGFAIPVNLAKRVVEDLVANGKVTRAYIGISPQEITSDLMDAFNLTEVSGVLVAKVELDSPAHKAGLEAGDVILEFNGEKVPNVSKFRIAVATSRVGTKVPVRIIRENKVQTVHIQLDSYPEDGPLASSEEPEVNGGPGITVEATDSAYARRNNITAEKGVIISTIEPNSAAAKAGLQVGFVILRVDRDVVNTPEEYESAMQKALDRIKKEDRKIITLYVMDRNKNEQFTVLRFD
ncbi:MAG: Do family serine endopeptidase [Candidatus Syntrophosphaera sp.]|nr:Do family serine endopeptidase [Candidatus Syntrophosphaera sp.]